MTARSFTDNADFDDTEAKAARAKTFHISPAEGDGDGKWYEIFVRAPADRAALVGADPADFEFGDRADDPNYVLVHYDATNDTLDPSFGYVEGSGAHETERAIFNEFENDLLEEAREDERLRTAPVAEVLVEADAVIETAQAFLTEDGQF